jgi:hypothetical protein
LVKQITEIADTDADGKLSFEEFCDAVLNNLMVGNLMKLNLNTPSM